MAQTITLSYQGNSEQKTKMTISNDCKTPEPPSSEIQRALTEEEIEKCILSAS